jgi:hypothetical protein
MSPIYHCSLLGLYGAVLRDPSTRLKLLSRAEVVALTLQGSHFIRVDKAGDDGCTEATCGSICKRLWSEAYGGAEG